MSLSSHSAPVARPHGASPDTDRDDSELVIRPTKGWIAIDWAELARGRELLYFLAWRDIKIRYKQTVLGAAWAILQPLFTMMIFTVIFGNFAKIPSDGVPYPLFVFAGLMPWTFFANGVNTAGMSLVTQQQLLTKIYFPRLFVPTSAVGGQLVDLGITLALFGVLLALFRFAPSWQVVFLPAILAMTVVATLGLGYFLAALTVQYRDFRFVIPFMIQTLMYVSAVFYSVNLLSPGYRLLLSLNPMCGLITACRSAVLGTPWDLPMLAISSVVALGMLALGLFYFRKTERRFADIA